MLSDFDFRDFWRNRLQCHLVGKVLLGQNLSRHYQYVSLVCKTYSKSQEDLFGSFFSFKMNSVKNSDIFCNLIWKYVQILQGQKWNSLAQNCGNFFFFYFFPLKQNNNFWGFCKVSSSTIIYQYKRMDKYSAGIYLSVKTT